MTKGEIAENYFLKGYNCTQSVLLAFCDDLGFDEETAMKISLPFGGGMGRLREVCGTVSGMYMVLGLSKGTDIQPNHKNKADIYKSVQQLAEQFSKDNGSIICRELLGLDIKGKDTPQPEERTEQYYKKRPCPKLCNYAATLIEEYLKQETTNSIQKKS